MFRLPAARNPAADAEHLRLALDAAQLGAWDYDATTGATTISPRFEEILGLAPGGFGGTLADLVERIHPDDRGVIELGRRFGLEHNLDIHVEYRIVRPDGEVRWLEGRGSLRTDDAEVVGSLGVVMDVTERRLAEQRREALAAGLALQTRAAELLIDLDARNRVSDLADVLVPALADCCAVYLVERDEIRLAGARHAEPEHEPAFRELLETVPASVDQPYGAGAVIRTGEPQLAVRDGVIRVPRLAKASGSPAEVPAITGTVLVTGQMDDAEFTVEVPPTVTVAEADLVRFAAAIRWS